MAYEGKTYTIEEAKIHGKKIIAEQAEILRKNLREQKKHNEILYV